jgi:hypothetical protein
LGGQDRSGRRYYDLIAWLNARGLNPDLKMVGTLEEGAFGSLQKVSDQSKGSFILNLPLASHGG